MVGLGLDLQTPTFEPAPPSTCAQASWRELEAISLQNFQACKPRATNGLKQFMISGLLDMY